MIYDDVKTIFNEIRAAAVRWPAGGWKTCRTSGLATLLLLLGPLSFALGTTMTTTPVVIRVQSLEAMQEALNVATAGTEIVLADGTYPMNGDIEISARGRQGAPVTLRAATDGGAVLTGRGSLRLTKSAAYVTVRGFYFKNNHHEVAARSMAGSEYCRWTRNIFEMPGKGVYLMVAGNGHEIDYNNFQHKNSVGQMLAIRGEGSQIAQRLHIHHNYFYDFKDQGGVNGAEAVQFGLSGLSLSSSNSVFEYNLFEACHGEAELLSVKASHVLVRFNTVRECEAQLTLRHGNFNRAYGNYFQQTPGLRLFGDDHEIFGNYFTQCKRGITIGNGNGEVADGAKVTCHDRPDRILIAKNTLVENHEGIVLQSRKNGMGATYVSVMDNIIQGGEVSLAVRGPLVHSVWKNNLIHQVAAPDKKELDGASYSVGDPGLRAVEDGRGGKVLAPLEPPALLAGDRDSLTALGILAFYAQGAVAAYDGSAGAVAPRVPVLYRADVGVKATW